MATVKQATPSTFAPNAGKNDMVTLEPVKGGREFTINGITYNRTFKKDTAQPEGDKDPATAKYKVKKK